MLQPSPNIASFCRDCQADEMWRFVSKKKNKQWIWLAIDSNTKQIIGFYRGDRSEKSAQNLMSSLPEVYRNKADFFTDDWEAYKSVIPPQWHSILFQISNLVESAVSGRKKPAQRPDTTKFIFWKSIKQSSRQSWQYRMSKSKMLEIE